MRWPKSGGRTPRNRWARRTPGRRPACQQPLDGGHIAHALLGSRRADWLGKAALALMVVLGLLVWSGLLFWALFVFLVGGTRGARTDDDATPLDPSRRALAFAAFAILALILLPLPHVLAPTLSVYCPYL